MRQERDMSQTVSLVLVFLIVLCCIVVLDLDLSFLSFFFPSQSRGMGFSQCSWKMCIKTCSKVDAQYAT